MTIYVNVTRWRHGLELDIPGIGITQTEGTRSLITAREMVTDYLQCLGIYTANLRIAWTLNYWTRVTDAHQLDRETNTVYHRLFGWPGRKQQTSNIASITRENN